MKNNELNKSRLLQRFEIAKGWKKEFKGKNITEIARMAGVSTATIHSAIRGFAIPTCKTISKIQEAIKHYEH